MDVLEKILLGLLNAETEEEINKIIRREKILENNNNWKSYGNLENNWGSAGNQQDEACAALVEKVTNSIDAMLLLKCKLAKIDPTSKQAPRDIFEAAEKFFNIKKNKIIELPKNELTELANNIQLIATGQKGSIGYPTLSIADFGEGQNPKDFPDTFLSLYKSNKSNIPFVTGKFNMGGTGVIRFCSKINGYQLIISKKSPELKGANNLWGYTLIRRLRPVGSMKNSMIQYFAPNGDIPIINKKVLNLLPYCKGDVVEPYKLPMEWGTFIKLYEYQIAQRTNILYDLFVELSKLLYEIPLPIRLIEGRSYEGHTMESNLIGMDQRLEVDRSELLDSTFSSKGILGQLGRAQIKYYLFKYGTDRNQLRRWIGNRSIYFTINGQTNARLYSSFLKRQKIRLDHLKDYLLICIDCTNVPTDVAEDLFMPSRDRMTNGEIRYQIEEQLEYILKSHDGLTEKNEVYRQEKVKDKIADDSIKIDVLSKIIKSNPILSKLFGEGVKLTDPFERGVKEEEFVGKRFPTYFKIAKKYKTGKLIKECPIDSHCVVLFKTDAVNDYLTRLDEPGELIHNNEEYTRNIFLYNGILHFEIHPNGDSKVGDELDFEVKLTSPSEINGYFQESFKVLITDSHKKHKRKKVQIKKKGLAFPEIIPVTKDEWEDFGWNEYDAIDITHTKKKTDAFINIDNIHLRREIDNDSNNAEIIKDQYSFSMVILGLAIKEKIESFNSEEMEKEEVFRFLMNSLGSIIIPVIRNIGKLEEL